MFGLSNLLKIVYEGASEGEIVAAGFRCRRGGPSSSAGVSAEGIVSARDPKRLSARGEVGVAEGDATKTGDRSDRERCGDDSPLSISLRGLDSQGRRGLGLLPCLDTE